MSRKFNTKKFFKDVLNDRYALVIGNEIALDTKTEFTYAQRTVIQSVVEVLFYPSYSPLLVHLWSCFGTVKEIAGFSHTLASCLSKLRSNIEAGKKQPRVWLQYVCGVTEVFFYPSFGVVFKPTFLTLSRANAFVLHSLNRKVPLVLLWSLYGNSEDVHYILGWRTELPRGCDGDLTEVYTSGNVCPRVHETGFVVQRIHVHRPIHGYVS